MLILRITLLEIFSFRPVRRPKRYAFGARNTPLTRGTHKKIKKKLKKLWTLEIATRKHFGPTKGRWHGDLGNVAHSNCNPKKLRKNNWHKILVLLTCSLVQHSHKKLHSLETCARLLFLLLQDFFPNVRLHRVHKTFFYRSVQYIICTT